MDNYVRYTFYRLCKEHKVSENSGYACFNTGLISKRHKPIYALFKKYGIVNPKKWRYLGIYEPGQQSLKNIFQEYFNSEKRRPQKAYYFGNPSDIIYDWTKKLDLQNFPIDHIMDRMDRFPKAYIEKVAPGLKPGDLSIKTDLTVREKIEKDLKNAIEKALVRVELNYKTAVPIYYPEFNIVALVLPLALGNSHDDADLALVVQRGTGESSGCYRVNTIFTLDMAYNDARVITRPDSGWLIPENILAGEESTGNSL